MLFQEDKSMVFGKSFFSLIPLYCYN